MVQQSTVSNIRETVIKIIYYGLKIAIVLVLVSILALQFFDLHAIINEDDIARFFYGLLTWFLCVALILIQIDLYLLLLYVKFNFTAKCFVELKGMAILSMIAKSVYGLIVSNLELIDILTIILAIVGSICLVWLRNIRVSTNQQNTTNHPNVMFNTNYNENDMISPLIPDQGDPSFLL